MDELIAQEADDLLSSRFWYTQSTDEVAKAGIRAEVMALAHDLVNGLSDAEYKQRMAALNAWASEVGG